MALDERDHELEAARKQVDRILASDTLHASDVLRRLLRFLADKTFSGEADDLKEYSVGLDALGKPPTYDPRQDAGVRLQASRLRQKLDAYYRTEGRNDPLIIELPKGRFKLVWQPRGGDSPAPLPVVAPSTANLKKWRSLAIILALVSLILACVSTWSIFRALRAPSRNPAISRSTPELDAFWNPLISSTHRLIIAFSDPVFVRFQRNEGPDILYRRKEVSGWDEAFKSPEFSVLRRSLGNPVAKPSFDYALRSQLFSTFVLGQFFARRRGDVSLKRLGELSWQEFADNDVLLLSQFKIDEQQTALPVRPAFILCKDGVRNIRPLAGEPPVFSDPIESHPESDGETLELVSVMPGPLGRTTVVSFTGNKEWGVSGAVQSLTDPAFAGAVVQKLREPGGKIPHYHQIVMRIRYRDGIPTHSSYVTHRALSLTQNSHEAMGH